MVDTHDQALRFPLTRELGLDEHDIARRKEWLQFDDADEQRLIGLNALGQQYADEVIEELYRHFLAFEETRAFFMEPGVLDHVKRMQRQYFRRLTQGNYDGTYVEDRLRVGAVHERVGLDVKWYLGAYAFYIRIVGQRIFDAYKHDPDLAQAIYFSLNKLIFLDIGLALDTYIFRSERTIREQQDAIRELSTPVLRLREKLLILPIIGVIDSARALQLTEELLRSIRINHAKVAVMDITGVPVVDSRVANHLIQTVEAARLMGATVILTGLSPEIARTLVALGVDLSRVNTKGDLQDGIEEAEQLLGYRVIKTAGSPAEPRQP